jgi:hypothetical protein
MSWFHLPFAGIVLYPALIAWTATALACLLLGSACLTACRQSQVDLRDVVTGAYRFALIAFAPAALLYLVGRQAPVFELARDASSGLPDTKHIACGAALIAGLSIILQRRLRERCGPYAASLGALATIAVFLFAVTLALPGAGYVLAWPLLAASAALADVQSRRPDALPRPLSLALLVGGFAPALLLVLPALRDMLAVPSPGRVLAGAALLALFFGFSSLLLALIPRRLAAGTLAIASLALLALPGTAAAPAGAPPKPNPLIYYKDMPTWSEWWLSRDQVLDDSTRSIFAALPKPRRHVDVFGWDSDDLWYARAPDSGQVSFPYAIQLVNDQFPKRRIVFDLTSKNGAPNIELRVRGGKPWRVAVNGIEVTSDDQVRNWSMSIYGMDRTTLHFELDMVGDPLLAVQVEERIPGVPVHLLNRQGLADRFMPATGQTITTDTMWFR